MSTQLTYLFDPLCGWCYGASPAIQQLAHDPAFTVELAPTGLFSGSGRTMDPAFADFAWSNDVRIAKLTGQRFTEDYRKNVLGKTGNPIDSATGTLALSAVAMTAPAREADALRVLQEARYVQGLDTANVDVVAQLLRDLGLAEAAQLLLSGAPALQASNTARLHAAQQLMRAHRAQGVPALVVHAASGDRLLQGQLLYGRYEDLLANLASA